MMPKKGKAAAATTGIAPLNIFLKLIPHIKEYYSSIQMLKNPLSQHLSREWQEG